MADPTSRMTQLSSAPTAAERTAKKARGHESASVSTGGASFSKSLQAAEQVRPAKARAVDRQPEFNQTKSPMPAEAKATPSVVDASTPGAGEESEPAEAVDPAVLPLPVPATNPAPVTGTHADWRLDVSTQPGDTGANELDDSANPNLLTVTAPIADAVTAGFVAGADKPGLMQSSAANAVVPAGDMTLTASALPTKGAETPASGELLAWRSQYIDAAQSPDKALSLEASPENLLETDADADADVLKLLAGGELASARLPGGSLHAGALNGKVGVAVNVPFGTDQWQQAIGERAVLLVRQNIQSAELQLDPPELGPLQVRIQINQDHAVVNFSSANAQVREALDQTLARLKEMLQEQGFTQVETGVSDQSQQQSRQHNARAGTDPQGVSHEQEATSEHSISSGIDYFA